MIESLWKLSKFGSSLYTAVIDVNISSFLAIKLEKREFTFSNGETYFSEYKWTQRIKFKLQRSISSPLSIVSTYTYLSIRAFLSAFHPQLSLCIVSDRSTHLSIDLLSQSYSHVKDFSTTTKTTHGFNATIFVFYTTL